MKTISKQDKLRMLGRMACEVSWSHLKPDQLTAIGLIAPDFTEALIKLRRFTDRNIDTPYSDDRGGITLDDIGHYIIDDLTVDMKNREFSITVNDRTYDGDFDLKDNGGLEMTNLKVYGPEASILNEATRNTDALLVEYVTAQVSKAVDAQADEYEAPVPRHLEYNNDEDL